MFPISHCAFMIPCVPKITLFPYTTLFRSSRARSLSLSAPGRSKSTRPVPSSFICAPVTSAPSKSRQTRARSEEHTSELQSLRHLVCRLQLEKKNTNSNENKRGYKIHDATK